MAKNTALLVMCCEQYVRLAHGCKQSYWSRRSRTMRNIHVVDCTTNASRGLYIGSGHFAFRPTNGGQKRAEVCTSVG